MITQQLVDLYSSISDYVDNSFTTDPVTTKLAERIALCGNILVNAPPSDPVFKAPKTWDEISNLMLLMDIIIEPHLPA